MKRRRRRYDAEAAAQAGDEPAVCRRDGRRAAPERRPIIGWPFAAGDIELLARALAAELKIDRRDGRRFRGSRQASEMDRPPSPTSFSRTLAARSFSPAIGNRPSSICWPTRSTIDLENVGETVEYIEPPIEARPESRIESLVKLTESLDAAARSSVWLILGGNPAFTAPADIPFVKAIEKAAAAHPSGACTKTKLPGSASGICPRRTILKPGPTRGPLTARRRSCSR